MPTEILAVASGADDSEDVVIADGGSLTVALKDAAAPRVTRGARVDILIKDDSDAYWHIDQLTDSKPVLVIAGAGTYRFSRTANGVSCGVFSG